MSEWVRNYARNDRKAFIGLCAALAVTIAFIGYAKLNQYHNPSVQGPWIVRHLLQDWVNSGGIESTHSMWIVSMKRELRNLEDRRNGSGIMSPKSRKARQYMDRKIDHLRQQIARAEKDQKTPGLVRRQTLNK